MFFNPQPFQQDTSIIREREISSGKTTACGRTKAGGNVDIAAEMAKGALFPFLLRSYPYLPSRLTHERSHGCRCPDRSGGWNGLDDSPSLVPLFLEITWLLVSFELDRLTRHRSQRSTKTVPVLSPSTYVDFALSSILKADRPPLAGRSHRYRNRRVSANDGHNASPRQGPRTSSLPHPLFDPN